MPIFLFKKNIGTEWLIAVERKSFQEGVLYERNKRESVGPEELSFSFETE